MILRTTSDNKPETPNIKRLQVIQVKLIDKEKEKIENNSESINKKKTEKILSV
jgi:hypothetical protein